LGYAEAADGSEDSGKGIASERKKSDKGWGKLAGKA